MLRDSINRISDQHIFLPPSEASLFPRVRPLPSGANRFTGGEAVRQGSPDFADRSGRQHAKRHARPDRDDADSIITSHLQYRGNGVWVSAGLRTEIAGAKGAHLRTDRNPKERQRKNWHRRGNSGN